MKDVFILTVAVLLTAALVVFKKTGTMHGFIIACILWTGGFICLVIASAMKG